MSAPQQSNEEKTELSDLVWSTIISMVLAVSAILVGVVDALVEPDYVSLALGLGAASIAFSVLALRE